MVFNFGLYIWKNTNIKNCLNIDFCGYNFKDNSDGIKDIFEYNDLFSKIVADNYKDVKYLISPTLTRIEGQTLFFDEVFKYKHLIELIERPEQKQNIKILNLDYIVFKALIKYLKKKGLTFRYNFLRKWIYELMEFPLFLLKLIKRLTKEFILMLISKLTLPSPKFKSYDYIIYSFYDERSNHNGVYYDVYFGPLINYILSKQNRVMVFSIPLISKPYQMYKYVHDISKMNNGFEVKICSQLYSLIDILKSIFAGFFSRVVLKEQIVFKNIDITYLTNLSLREDYFRCNWLFSYLQYYCSKHLFKEYNVKNMLYPYENHPYEKLLILAKNESKVKTKFTGFQHTSFSFKLLNHLPGKYEKNLPIFPDKILTVGSVLKNVMTEFGNYPENIIEEGCALRHPYLFKDVNLKNKKVFSKEIAYAFSFDLKNYSAIIDNLIKIFKETKYVVYLKLHPLFESKRGLIKKGLPLNFIVATDIPWEDLFKRIDLLLYDGNSICIEALKYNVIPVYFGLNGEVYDTDQLYNYKGDKIRATDMEIFKKWIDGFYETDPGRALQKNYRYNQEYLYQYFSPVTEEKMDRFL